MNFRTVRVAPAKVANEKFERWPDKAQPTTIYRDEVESQPANFDPSKDASILYCCRENSPGDFDVLLDTGLAPKMMHTFAGWPISAPVGKVSDPDPLAPKTAEAAPVDVTPKG